jgi:aldo/keto reductase family protein
VSTALQAGYRHIDTPQMYGNEAEAGEAIARPGLDRGEVFVTSKLGNDAHEPGDARRAIGETLKALGTRPADLFLIHWPLPGRYGGDFTATWRVPEEACREAGPGQIAVEAWPPRPGQVRRPPARRALSAMRARPRRLRARLRRHARPAAPSPSHLAVARRFAGLLQVLLWLEFLPE